MVVDLQLPRTNDPLFEGFTAGRVGSSLFFPGLPAVGMRSFINTFRGAHRDHGLLKSLSMAYQASRGAISGSYDMGKWFIGESLKSGDYWKPAVYGGMAFEMGSAVSASAGLALGAINLARRQYVRGLALLGLSTLTLGIQTYAALRNHDAVQSLYKSRGV